LPFLGFHGPGIFRSVDSLALMFARTLLR